MEVQHNERVYESVGEIRPWQFESPGQKKGAIVRRGSRARDASILCDSEFRA